jgi:hypothetical protein
MDFRSVQVRAYPSAPRNRLFRCRHGKGEHNLRQAILVLGVGALNVGFGVLQGGLAEFHDGTSPGK